MNNPLINILTRTSDRPNYFKNCFDSVNNQTYKNINHIISVDNDNTEEYVKKYTQNYIKVFTPKNIVIKKYKERRYAPYNLYLNDLRKEVKEGWIMYLDDDDSFFDENSLQNIVNHIENEDQILIWRVQFPNVVIPQDSFFNKKIIALNHFSSISFLYNKKYDIYSDWESYSGGDYFFVKDLYPKIPYNKWINEIYTKLQRNDMSGFGKKDDII